MPQSSLESEAEPKRGSESPCNLAVARQAGLALKWQPNLGSELALELAWMPARLCRWTRRRERGPRRAGSSRWSAESEWELALELASVPASVLV